jgi:hypothetical protein
MSTFKTTLKLSTFPVAGATGANALHMTPDIPVSSCPGLWRKFVVFSSRLWTTRSCKGLEGLGAAMQTSPLVIFPVGHSSGQTRRRYWLSSGVPMVVGLALSSYATASFALGTAEQRVACTPDVFRLCSSEIPNVEHIISCMKAKKAGLSQACRSVFDTPTSNKAASSE